MNTKFKGSPDYLVRIRRDSARMLPLYPFTHLAALTRPAHQSLASEFRRGVHRLPALLERSQALSDVTVLEVEHLERGTHVEGPAVRVEPDVERPLRVAQRVLRPAREPWVDVYAWFGLDASPS